VILSSTGTPILIFPRRGGRKWKSRDLYEVFVVTRLTNTFSNPHPNRKTS
jgi:hypothetical protein